ncbi:hypothetical protein LJC56_03675 [Christensenellaceae bacterium OttesenSCG-928-K19]|nr:hypothetical protein [Christensenellaceae bacterium OttesenSCG-928-K19]
MTENRKKTLNDASLDAVNGGGSYTETYCSQTRPLICTCGCSDFDPINTREVYKGNGRELETVLRCTSCRRIFFIPKTD